jgi:hypothetical protein
MPNARYWRVQVEMLRRTALGSPRRHRRRANQLLPLRLRVRIAEGHGPRRAAINQCIRSLLT